MSTVRDIIHSVWLCCQLAIAAFFLGTQLFYIVGPLVIGAFVTMFGFAVVARYLIWPAARFAVTGVYRLGAWAVRGLFGRPQVIVPATARTARAPSFAHPVA